MPGSLRLIERRGDRYMCGLGFVGLLIFLFYTLLVLTLLAYGGWQLGVHLWRRVHVRGTAETAHPKGSIADEDRDLDGGSDGRLGGGAQRELPTAGRQSR
jgi:hypothetical protein